MITLDDDSAETFERHNLNYKFSRQYFDTLEMENNVITISGDRSDKPVFNEIFTNNQSEIYFQIIKSYIYYCISNGIIPDILEIRCYNKDHVLEKKYTRRSIRNLKPQKDARQLKNIIKTKAAVIFKATPESNKYLYAMTTLIRSMCSDDNNDIFEKLWKSYNSIYRVLSSQASEAACLADMGGRMITRVVQFPLSVDVVKTLSSIDITNSTRWRRMLEYKYITKCKPQNRENYLSAFLTKYSDTRLNEIALLNMDLEKKSWTNSNLQTTTLTTIQNNITTRTINNGEVIDALCNYYAYYLRNNTLHGDQADHSFRFIPDNKEERTLKFTSSILFAVVCDLINSHNI
ncbi:hypothetical protein [Enterobacter quasiroggenkampii]|uniref:hypothetical protein n=1 Tax=Enterobacter quasiroggenkampii TaxID=2497436 RepID=UPI00207623F6|nr:hypothetical protein [Enterobacter quasiroggenkampii]MCM7169121.1 hypothetical protein [Enterobacter quasiroggenkampii]